MIVDGDWNANGYVVLKQFFTPEISRLIFDYARLKKATGQMERPDGQVPTALRLRADPLTETLLLESRAAVERIVGTSLWPSYSYLRLHTRGAAMGVHTDRKASEIAISVNVGGDRLWPLWLKTPTSDLGIAPEIGDGVVYRGRELPHWRNAYDGELQVQCLLFYVRRDGDAAACKYDGRAGVGVPYANRQPAPAAQDAAVEA